MDRTADKANDHRNRQRRLLLSPGWNKDYPKIQILTVEELLGGKTVQLPSNIGTFKQAEKVTGGNDGQASLSLE